MGLRDLRTQRAKKQKVKHIRVGWKNTKEASDKRVGKGIANKTEDGQKEVGLMNDNETSGQELTWEAAGQTLRSHRVQNK